MVVKIKKTHPDAVIPKYSKPGDAGMDLTAVAIVKSNSHQVTYDLGISIEVPEGYVALIFPRSSIRDKDLVLSNSVGVIDSGYRGNIQATFNITNELMQSFKYKIGERVAQMIIIPYPQVQFEEVEELSTTERGEGGFGSTN